jgi:hypothetical protein
MSGSQFVGSCTTTSTGGDVTVFCGDVTFFYGINAKQTDDAASFKGINTFAFNADDFYLTQNAPNTDEVVVNLRGNTGGGGISSVTFKESEVGGFSQADDTVSFDSNDFYLTSGGDGKPLVSAIDKGFITADDVGPGFYGISVCETDGTGNFSGINKLNFNSDDFYITQNDPNTDEVIINFRGFAPDEEVPGS